MQNLPKAKVAPPSNQPWELTLQRGTPGAFWESWKKIDQVQQNVTSTVQKNMLPASPVTGIIHQISRGGQVTYQKWEEEKGWFIDAKKQEPKIFLYPLGSAAYTDGDGFGSESISGVNYINFPAGYHYLRNLVYREDGTLRPWYKEETFGSTVSGGNVVSMFCDNEYAYAVAGGNLYYGSPDGGNWQKVTWSGIGDAPSLPEGQYEWTMKDESLYVKNKTQGEPVYVINPSFPGFWRNNWGRTGWARGYSKTSTFPCASGAGTLLYSFPANKEPGILSESKLYGNQHVYNWPADKTQAPTIDTSHPTIYAAVPRITNYITVGVFNGIRYRLRRQTTYEIIGAD